MKPTILLLLSLALLAGCAAPAPTSTAIETASPTTAASGEKASRERPPALTVQVGESEGQAVLSTWSWDWPNGDGTRTGVEADGLHPLEMGKDLTPLPGGQDAQLTLRFDLGDLSIDRLTLIRWDRSAAEDPLARAGDGSPIPFALDGDTVTATLPAGGIFQVHAYFTGDSFGDGYYAFCVADAQD